MKVCESLTWCQTTLNFLPPWLDQLDPAGSWIQTTTKKFSAQNTIGFNRSQRNWFNQRKERKTETFDKNSRSGKKWLPFITTMVFRLYLKNVFLVFFILIFNVKHAQLFLNGSKQKCLLSIQRISMVLLYLLKIHLIFEDGIGGYKKVREIPCLISFYEKLFDRYHLQLAKRK